MARGRSWLAGAAILGMACSPLHDLNDITGADAPASGGSSSGGAESGGQGGTLGETGGASATGGEGSESGGNSSGGSGGTEPVDDFCPETYAFCDDFEDIAASNWTVSGGNWAIVPEGDNNAYYGANSEEAVAGESDWENVTVEARVRILEWGGATDEHRAGIIGRYDDSSSFYVFALGGDGNATLRKSTSTLGGATGTCGPAPVAFEVNEWVDLRLEIFGPSANVIIATFINDEPVHSCATTSNTVAQGAIGLSTFGAGTRAAFDDVRVTVQ